MGSLFSLFQNNNEEDEEEEERHLLRLLNGEDDEAIDWREVQRRVQEYPEEAAAYAHGVGLSPLQRCLLLRPPLFVVKEIVEAYPEAIYSVDGRGDDDDEGGGRSALYTAVQAPSSSAPPASVVTQDGYQDEEGTSVEVIEYILSLDPSAVSKRTLKRKVPLHCAKQAAVCQLLLQAHPESVAATDSQEQTPLHCIVQNITTSPNTSLPEAVKCLIQAAQQQGEPTVADGFINTPNANGKSPIQLVYDQLQEARRKDSTDMDKVAAHCAAIWNVLVVLIEAAYKARTTANNTATTNNDASTNGNEQQQQPRPQEPPFPSILHAAVTLQCPVAVIEYIMQIHDTATLAATRDADGYTPLMLATVSHVTPDIICCLLQCFPGAARMTDNTGRLPIDIAAEFSEYNDALWDFLVAAEPRAVDTRDLRDKRFPFLTAAMAESASLSTVYRLLRAKPHVISFYANKQHLQFSSNNISSSSSAAQATASLPSAERSKCQAVGTSDDETPTTMTTDIVPEHKTLLLAPASS